MSKASFKSRLSHKYPKTQSQPDVLVKKSEKFSRMNKIKGPCSPQRRLTGSTRWTHGISYCSGPSREDNKWSGARQKHCDVVDGTLYYHREQITVCTVYCRNGTTQDWGKEPPIFPLLLFLIQFISLSSSSYEIVGLHYMPNPQNGWLPVVGCERLRLHLEPATVTTIEV